MKGLQSRTASEWTLVPKSGYLWFETVSDLLSSSLVLSKEPLVQISEVSFVLTDWAQVECTEHKGETGTAYWRTLNFGDIRVRMVEYTPGYLADHWCSKGHVLLCLEGQLHTELRDGRKFTLKPGMSYQVADNAEAHRSSTATGARLFVVD